MWSRSAANGERPWRQRRTINAQQSTSGMAIVHGPSTGDTGCSGFWLSRIEVQAIMKPSTVLPARNADFCSLNLRPEAVLTTTTYMGEPTAT